LVLAYVHTLAYGLMPSFYRLISGGFLGLQSVTIFLLYYSICGKYKGVPYDATI
jgi:hypothetical protein